MSTPITEYQKLFGQKVKKLRERRKMSQLDLAVACNVEKTAISRIERGRTNPTLKTAVALSQALEVKIKTLFDF
ncbi:hypothetical protein A8C56_23515 [Niabella ginsenosidivorans]|uniref:HTH cro/C1-type domain-containing protein n=1 Tax=Niabella ginsenosidivorans TaxID=1176587 RepID=A0A1A9I885_9BACT|nr:helix-turn-helix transcriptional regulator [Niabella ginsenosidivorans]ANH83545.1 hypothetical protein A8C56_23515 [Niabella ginsenosidivorans]